MFPCSLLVCRGLGDLLSCPPTLTDLAHESTLSTTTLSDMKQKVVYKISKLFVCKFAQIHSGKLSHSVFRVRGPSVEDL